MTGLPLYHELDPTDRKADHPYCDECGEEPERGDLFDVDSCELCEDCIRKEISEYEEKAKKLKSILG
jgi:NAD-dependent SIR2 family protein deacetylase